LKTYHGVVGLRLIVKNFKEEICTMAKGTVKWFNDNRGYGFISESEGKDIFVHYTSIVSTGFRSLSEGDEVSFEVEETEQGLKAKNVIKL